jgi:hypothetical protein
MGVRPRGIEARHPSPTPLMTMFPGQGSTLRAWRNRDKRKELLAGLSGTHALRYWASAQRVRAFTGGRSASRARLTR